MSVDATADEADVRARVASFLRRNFPQIAMHGGDAAIEGLDLETGEVWIQLGGACSGCGISPMTVQAIQHRLVQEIEGIEQVYADAGYGHTLAESSRGDPAPDAPF